MSAAVAKRASGFFATAFMTTASSSGDTSRLCVLGGKISIDRTAFSSCASVSPLTCSSPA